MNRKPEKICGMIGACLATALMAYSLYIAFQVSANPMKYESIGIHFTESDIKSLYILYIPALLASIISIAAAWLVDRKTKIAGITMILSAIVIIFSNIINIVSFVLLMAAGVMCLVRTPKAKTISS